MASIKNGLKNLKTASVFVFAALAFPLGASAQAPTNIFNNVFDLNATGDGAGGFVYNEVYSDLPRGGLAGSAGSWTLSPNTGYYEDVCYAGNPDPGALAFWCQGTDAAGSGNKWIQAIMSSDELVPIGPGGTYTFTACSDTSGLSAPYVVTNSFIKVLTDGAANGDGIYNVIGEVYGAGSGSTDLSIDVLGDTNVIVQKGFTFEGPNANPAAVASIGAAGVSVGATCSVAPPPSTGPDAESAKGIPVLPFWGLLGLTALLGLFGTRQLSKNAE